MRKAIALIASIFCVAAFGNDMTQACQGNAPTDTEYRNDPKAYADNFCALWLHERAKALRQLSQGIVSIRAFNNPARMYFNPKQFAGNKYIQLRRPWMEGREVVFFADDNERERVICVENRSCTTLYVSAPAVFRSSYGNVDAFRTVFAQVNVSMYGPNLDVEKTFPTAVAAKECVETLLERMEHQDYEHHSVTAACGSI